MISRKISRHLLKASEGFPVVTLLGPRQSGKTTLVRAVFPNHTYINLENPQTRAFFREDPRSLLQDGDKNLIIDEAQREPEILSWVQVFCDKHNTPGQYILTGSSQPSLSEAISQSLAGRTSIHYLLPLSLEELIEEGISLGRDEMLFKGFLPRLYDASLSPGELYSAYYATYVERDLRRLIQIKDLSKFDTFVRLLAGRVGQMVNLSSLAGDAGVSSTTLSAWLSALEASFIIFRLTPYHKNLGKRLVKTPKIYFTEPGLLSWLLQIESPAQVSRDPLLGGLFENMAIIETCKAAYNRGLEPRLSFYRDASGFEVDLIREHQRKPFAMEIKAGMTFSSEMTKSLHRFSTIIEDLAGSALIYGGDELRRVNDITVSPCSGISEVLFGSS